MIAETDRAEPPDGPHAYRGVMPDEYLDGLRPGECTDMWRRSIEANCFGQRDVITVDAQVAGFAAYGPEPRPPLGPGLNE